MSKKKVVERPQYEQWSGNQYTNQLEEAIPVYGNWISNNWEPLTQTYDAEDMKEIAQKAYDTTWNDFLNNYRRQANAIAGQNYNRFGGLGSSPSMYTQDMLNRQMDDLSSRVGSQMYSMADQLAGNQMNRNLASLNAVNTLYNNAGQYVTQAKDLPNWEVRKLNQQNKYLDDVDRANSKSSWFDYLTNAISGSSQGAMQGFQATGSPWGALGGGIAGTIGGIADTYSGTGNQYTNALLSPFASMSSMSPLGQLGGSSSGGLNLNTKQNRIF